MSKSKSDKTRSSTSPSSSAQQDPKMQNTKAETLSNDDSSTQPRWETLFKTHISLIEAHVTLLDQLAQGVFGDTAATSEEEVGILGSMRERGMKILEDARKAGEVVGLKVRDEEANVRSSESDNEEDVAISPSAASKAGASHDSTGREKPTEESTSVTVDMRKRKADSEDRNDTPEDIKSERITIESACSTPASRPIKKLKSRLTPHRATNPLVDNAVSVVKTQQIDFAALHAQLQSEIEAGLRLQAEKAAEEEKERGKKDKKKRKRDSVGGEGIVEVKKVRNAGGVIETGNDVSNGVSQEGRNVNSKGNERKRKAEGDENVGIVVPINDVARTPKKKKGHISDERLMDFDEDV